MVIEDIKEPCVDCFYESNCTIRHPELLQKLGEPTVAYCEKLTKYSSYVDATRPTVY